MKIVMFGHKRVPSREGGVEIVAEQLSSRMAERGHDVTCYNRRRRSGRKNREQEPTQHKGVKLVSVPTVDKKGLAAVTSSFFAAIRSGMGKADVVHIHAEGPAFMCWFPKLCGKRVVVTVHGLDWQRKKWRGGPGAGYIRAGEKMAVRFADEIIVLSRNIQDYFRDTYGRETVWIPNGVIKPERAEAEQIAERFGLEKDGYILFLGRLVPEKGVHYLIEAFRNVQTDKKLVIAGESADTDDYVRQLHELADGDSRIQFCGFANERLLRELYSNAWLYVLPSDLEGMPIGLLEAMSYGNCCLVSDISECAEVVEDRAAVFARGNVHDLRDHIQQLCDDPEKTRAYKAGAQRFICEKYNWDPIVDQTLELYQ